jgi:hypothetical protein
MLLLLALAVTVVLLAVAPSLVVTVVLETSTSTFWVVVLRGRGACRRRAQHGRAPSVAARCAPALQAGGGHRAAAGVPA